MRLQLLGALGELGGVDTKPGCDFECPAGHKPLARHNHVPSHNGCGSYGLKVGSWRSREGCFAFSLPYMAAETAVLHALPT
jgi:hypothetical protein